MAEVAGQEIVTKVRDILAPLGLELHPFKVCKYLNNLLMVIRPLVHGGKKTMLRLFSSWKRSGPLHSSDFFTSFFSGNWSGM